MRRSRPNATRRGEVAGLGSGVVRAGWEPPIDAGDDWDDWKEILKSAGVDKDARVHDARHTAATLLLEEGVDIRVIQAVLGHSQLATTKRYTHITETLASEAAARMGRALWDG